MLRPFFVVLLFVFVRPAYAEDPKFKVLFNGENLSGWAGADSFWSVNEGSIVGQTTAENPTSGNTFLVWQGGQVGDFEFRCKVRFEGNNSGVQYRSELADSKTFRVTGYQADLHSDPANFGMCYGENYAERGIIANRGQRVEVGPDGSKKVVATIPQSGTLIDRQWNDLRIIGIGNRLIHQINGTTTVDLTDNHPAARQSGVLALQLHAGAPMKVEFRGLLLRTIQASEATDVIAEVEAIDTAMLQPQTLTPDQVKRQWLTSAPKAQWIWSEKASANQLLYVRKSFDIDAAPKTASLYTTCDNRMKLWINGEFVAESADWKNPIDVDVAKYLKTGRNVIAAECRNEDGMAAYVLKLTATAESGSSTTIVSDTSWSLSPTAADQWQTPTYDDASWKSNNVKVIIGELGVAPWAVPNYKDSTATASEDPLNAKNVLTRPGFVIDQLYRVPKTEGSWVCLTTDSSGGFYASDEQQQGVFHITFDRSGNDQTPKVNVKKLLVNDPETGQLLSTAQGLLWAFDSLWLHRNGGHLYRITDANQDGTLDTAERYPSMTGGGEHGNHGLIVTEDGEAIYMAGGNHAPLAACESKRVQSWSEDQLLPRMWDANGHARGLLAPGGWVTRLNPKTKSQELICIGFRNQYDIAINRYGDMFTFDADMEWDMGSPWYRPTRICQVVSGGDFGWRSGSGKFPAYYEDSLPAAVDIGPGSPTGVVFGSGAKFPSKYQDALYALDWTFGTIYAVHLTPDGAGYNGTKEAFIYGTPLPVTDAVIGQDGHFYFTVGGRGSESAFYRARYVGDESVAPLETSDDPHAVARQSRRMLESFHGRADQNAVDAAWPFLQSNDRFLRNAARVALESQPVEQWANRVADESNPQAKITASIALARTNKPEHLTPLVQGLLELDVQELTPSEFLGLLRAYSLAFTRLGNPDGTLKDAVVASLNPLFPADSSDANQELLKVLAYLSAPDVIPRAMKLITTGSDPIVPDWEDVALRNPGYGASIQRMRENPTPAQEIGYAMSLRTLSQGWTLDDRRAYFEFLNRAAKASGGASYPGFLRNIRDEALQTCTNEHRDALQSITGEDFNPIPDFEIAPIAGPGQKWSVDSALATDAGKPNFERGRSLYFAADCGKCHRLTGLGGSVGPDLTSIPSKFDQRYVVEAIIHPSKNISDQYGSSKVLLSDGRALTGIAVENGDNLEIYPIQPTDQPIVVPRDEVELIEPSKVSQMPEGLLDRLGPEEVRDLMAYLMSGGSPKDRRYK